MQKTYTVSLDGTGDFTSIQEAINTAEEDVKIFIKSGTYKEQIFSIKKSLHVIGENTDTTIITGNIGAFQPFSDGSKTGTFRTYTAYFAGENLTLQNLTIENTAGQGCIAGQAIALYASASKVYCKNLKILGFQDTLFTAPLPEKERLAGGFIGPEEKLPRKSSQQYYEDCYISGTVDFIFGSADAVFEKCTIAIRNTTTKCYITAPSTPPNGIGYIFNNCCVIHENLFSLKKHEPIFLGRPWREYAKCCWLNSDFSNIICQDAWDNWNNKENEKTVSFCVYKNIWQNKGIAGKGTFTKVLDDEYAKKVLETALKIYNCVAFSCSREAIKKAPNPLLSSTTGASFT